MNDKPLFALSSHQMFELEKSQIINDQQGLYFMQKAGEAVYNHIIKTILNAKLL